LGSARAGPSRGASDEPPATAEPADPWSAAISEGLQALDRRAYAEAREAFARAEAARPGTQAVADGRLRAEEGLKGASLAERRRLGAAAESAEDWRRAIGEYDAALGLEPTVAFALEGRSRAVLRSELDVRLDGYLRRRDRLSSEPVAREAEAALDRARELLPAGPRLTSQVRDLEGALVEARTPVPVRLLSDGRTQVTVLRVGPLGTFTEKALDLRPGSYVVVGTRRGYRDARRTLEVAPGRAPEPLLVKCDEAI
ncbi:MAG TPA: hypothetical protein VIC87_06565, partial [Vicinamibacteria bacterium]